jgi:hypothetical protein
MPRACASMQYLLHFKIKEVFMTSKARLKNSMKWQILGVIAASSTFVLLSGRPAEASLTCFEMNDPDPARRRLTCVAVGRTSGLADRIDTGSYLTFRLPPGAVVWPGAEATSGNQWTAWNDMRGILRSALSCVTNHVSQVDCFGVGTDGSLVANYYADAAGLHPGRRNWINLGLPPDGPELPYSGARSGINRDPSCLAARARLRKGTIVPAVRCFVATSLGAFAAYDYDLGSGSGARHLPVRNAVNFLNWYWLGRPSLLSNPSCLTFNGSDVWCLGATSEGLAYKKFPRALEAQSKPLDRELSSGAWETILWSTLGNPKPRPSRLKCVDTVVGGTDLPRLSSGVGEATCFFPGSSSSALVTLNAYSGGALMFTRSNAPASLRPGIQECIYTAGGDLACLVNTPPGPDQGLKVVTFPAGGSGEVVSGPLGGTGNPTVISCAKTQITTRPTVDCIASEVGNPRSRMANYRLDAGSWNLVPESIPGASGEPPPDGEFQLCDPNRLLLTSSSCR